METWLEKNKKYAVFICIVGLLTLQMFFVAFGLPVLEIETELMMLLVIGVKEWLDGKSDT